MKIFWDAIFIFIMKHLFLREDIDKSFTAVKMNAQIVANDILHTCNMEIKKALYQYVHDNAIFAVSTNICSVRNALKSSTEYLLALPYCSR